MAKQGLSKRWNLKTKIGLILGRAQKHEGRKRREEEEEEEEKKKKRMRNQAKKVWKLLIMNSMRLCMNFHAWLVSSCPQTWDFARVSF